LEQNLAPIFLIVLLLEFLVDDLLDGLALFDLALLLQVFAEGVGDGGEEGGFGFTVDGEQPQNCLDQPFLILVQQLQRVLLGLLQKPHQFLVDLVPKAASPLA
jgi:hypothetical protein